MRWSYQSTLFIFGALIAAEVAISAPIYIDSDVLEARSPGVTRRSKRIAAAASGGGDGPATRSSTQASFPAVAASPRKVARKKTAKAILIGSPLRAHHIKKSSATYRRQALKSGLEFSRTGKTGLVESKTGSSIKGKDAGERFMNPKLLRIATEKYVIKIIWWRRRLWLMPLRKQVMQESE
jgi:hypothetical protein